MAPKNHTDHFYEILKNVAPELHPFINDHYSTWNLMFSVRETFSIELYQVALEQIEQELNVHFVQEEQLLLPILESYLISNQVGPSAKLIDEHRSINKKFVEVKQLFENFQKVQDNNENKIALTKQMNLLAYLVMKHIEKEDHYLYPMLSLIFTKEEKEKISLLLQINRSPI